MTILWSRKHPEQPNNAESSPTMYQVSNVALSALSKPWSGHPTHGKIEKTAASLNANQATIPGSHPSNTHPLAEQQLIFYECLRMMLENPGQTPPEIMNMLITQQASFMKKVILVKKQPSETNNHGREPLTPDDVSVPSSARTDPGPCQQDEYKDVNSAASAPAKLTTTNTDQPSVDSVVSDVSSDKWDTERINPSVVDAQQKNMDHQGNQIKELAIQQQASQTIIDQLHQQQKELRDKLVAANTKQVQLNQQHK